MLSATSSLNTVPSWPTLALQDAFRDNNEPRASALIELYPHLADVPDGKGRLPLHIAARKRFSRDFIDRLFASGARDDLDDDRGRLPVHCAVWGKETVQVSAFARLLQSSRISLDTATDDGKTPLLIAARRGHAVALQMLLRAGATPDCRYAEITADDLQRPVTNALIAYNQTLAEIPLPLVILGSPLVIAIDTLFTLPIIGQAIAEPIRLRRANKYRGITPLQCAARHNHRHVAEMLQIAYFQNRIPLRYEERRALAKRGWQPLDDGEIRARLACNLLVTADSLPEQTRQRLFGLLDVAQDANAPLLADQNNAEAGLEPDVEKEPNSETTSQEMHHEGPAQGSESEREQPAALTMEELMRRFSDDVKTLASRIAELRGWDSVPGEHPAPSNSESQAIVQELPAGDEPLRSGSGSGNRSDRTALALELEATLARRNSRAKQT